MERIDVHTHCVPPAYREYCMQNDFAGRGCPDAFPYIPKWSPAAHLELMKRQNIKISILSMSSPGTHLTPGNDAEARTLTRQANTYMAQVCNENPEQFRFFASLPLPDVEGSLAEIDYALDNLGAVGFQILTNSHSIYPGDRKFAPIFDKLNERKTTVFFHPTSCHVQSPDGSVQTVDAQPGLPRPVIEFMFESTRALTSLILSGTLTRCPDITFIVCHCGATFPPVLERIVEFSAALLGSEHQYTASQIKNILQSRFYFDLAGVPFPDQIQGLLRLVDTSRIVYGSDYPFTPSQMVASLADRVDEGLAQLGGDVKKNVLMKNALPLISNH